MKPRTKLILKIVIGILGTGLLIGMVIIGMPGI